MDAVVFQFAAPQLPVLKIATVLTAMPPSSGWLVQDFSVSEWKKIGSRRPRGGALVRGINREKCQDSTLELGAKPAAWRYPRSPSANFFPTSAVAGSSGTASKTGSGVL
jgi:hypothetical protein